MPPKIEGSSRIKAHISISGLSVLFPMLPIYILPMYTRSSCTIPKKNNPASSRLMADGGYTKYDPHQA